MTTLISKRGIRERDPSKWEIIKVEEGDDPKVTFQAGTYTNKAGMVIPVIFHCHKSGIIYRTWKEEMERRKGVKKIDSGAQELEEGKVIDIAHHVVRSEETTIERSARVTREAMTGEIGYIEGIKYHKTPVIDTQAEEVQHRLGEARKKYFALDWSDPEKDKALADMQALEKKLLGDP